MHAEIASLRGRLEALGGRGAEGLDLAEEAAQLAAGIQRLANGAMDRQERAMQGRIARMMGDAPGKVFTTALTDQAFRARDPGRVADQLRHLLDTHGVPRYMTTLERLQLRAFGLLSPLAARLLTPALQAHLRREMDRVLLPAKEDALAARLAGRNEEGIRVNLNHLGEAILGEEEACHRLATYQADVARPDVRCVSVKGSSIYSQLSLLAWEDTLSVLSERMRLLYRTAMANPHVRPDGTQEPKLVVLDMEEYRDVHLTLALFTRVLGEPEFLGCHGGIVLQAYLPDAHPLQRDLTRWAMDRVDRGGVPIRLRLVKGANLAMEHFEASHMGWELAPYGRKAEVDANYKRMVSWGMTPERCRAVHLGIGSHNLFDLAYGLVLRAARGVVDQVGFEMLEGMSQAVRQVVQEVAGDMLVYAPMVEDDQLETAIAYLIRRLDENTGRENFLSHSFQLEPDSPVWRDQEERFRRSVAELGDPMEGPRRTQDRRARPRPTGADEPFVNEPDTDWSLAHNRSWVLDMVARRRHWGPEIIPLQVAGRFVADTTAGLVDGLDPSRPGHVLYRYARADEVLVDEALDAAVAAGQAWSKRPASERGEILLAVAQGLREARGELIGAMVGDGAKAIEEGDVEVSEAIDFASYYARSLEPFEALGDLELRARGVVLVTPPWNFPLAIPAGGVFGALMAGNAVILKPASHTVLTSWLLAKVAWEAGVPRDVLQFIACQGSTVGSKLVADERVSAIVLTGGTSTALHFLSLRPELTLFAETGGKDAMVVTAMADRDLAIGDAVRSAFGHAGQKCSAASLLICEAEVYDDPVFMRRLADAARSLPVGSSWDPRSVVTPLISPARGDLARALTTLEEGEEWLLVPRQDPENPCLWSPGIKIGVRPGGYTHRTEFFGPVLGVMRADDLDHALTLANGTDYGLTAGLHSLDLREQGRWSEAMDAGGLYINRKITGAVVQRQPFGGRKASGFGPGAKAGGANYVLQLMEVRQDGTPGTPDHGEDGLLPDEAITLGAGLDEGDRLTFLASVASCVDWWARHFSRQHDPTGVVGEDNIFRYQPCRKILFRLGADADGLAAAQAMGAALIAGASFALSVAPELEADLGNLPPGVDVVRESDHTLAGRLPDVGADRLRLLGSAHPDLRRAAHGLGLALVDAPPVANGRVELLRVCKEQSLTVAYHRYGNLGARETVD